jgi:hypothetical protein
MNPLNECAEGFQVKNIIGLMAVKEPPRGLKVLSNEGMSILVALNDRKEGRRTVRARHSRNCKGLG